MSYDKSQNTLILSKMVHFSNVKWTKIDIKNNNYKKFELMLTRCSKAYSSSGSVY